MRQHTLAMPAMPRYRLVLGLSALLLYRTVHCITTRRLIAVVYLPYSFIVGLRLKNVVTSTPPRRTRRAELRERRRTRGEGGRRCGRRCGRRHRRRRGRRDAPPRRPHFGLGRRAQRGAGRKRHERRTRHGGARRGRPCSACRRRWAAWCRLHHARIAYIERRQR